MKVSYFPYLPNSRNEDNKRYKYIRDMMEKNPFTYHKKKNFSSIFNNNNNFLIIDNNINNNYSNKNQNQNNFNNNNINNINKIINSNGNNTNQELLIFQKANDNYMDSYNNFMRQKSSTIENNAQNYLNYLAQNKKLYKINNNEKINNILSYNNNYNNNNYINNLLPLSSESRGRKRLYENKSATNIKSISLRNNNYDIFNKNKNETEKINFIPSNIKARGSDITNPFFYDHIAKEIFKKNIETMDYNIKESENKYNKNKKISKYSDDKLPLAPGKINNPKYYNLGESVLDKNPILNKGDYSPSFSRNYKFFSRQENIFDI